MKNGLSGSTLKIIAIVTMFIDHVGAAVVARLMMASGFGMLDVGDESAIIQWFNDNTMLYSVYQVMRTIGRLAFPIYCFLLIEGFEHTHDRRKYALRLGLFALISEIPFDLAFNSEVLEFGYQNVFFTLFIGLLTMMLYRKLEDKTEWSIYVRMPIYLLIVAAGMGIAQVLRTDYSAIGILCIMVLYICRKTKVLQLAAGCVTFFWEPAAIFAFIPVAFYNGKRGSQIKYFFYIFYPAHLLLLYVVCYSMGIAGYSVI